MWPLVAFQKYNSHKISGLKGHHAAGLLEWEDHCWSTLILSRFDVVLHHWFKNCFTCYLCREMYFVHQLACAAVWIQPSDGSRRAKMGAFMWRTIRIKSTCKEIWVTCETHFWEMFLVAKSHIPHQSLPLLPADVSGWLLMYGGQSPSVSQTETMPPQFAFQIKAFACWQKSAGKCFKWTRSSRGVTGPRCRGGPRLPGQWSASVDAWSCWRDGGCAALIPLIVRPENVWLFWEMTDGERLFFE